MAVLQQLGVKMSCFRMGRVFFVGQHVTSHVGPSSHLAKQPIYDCTSWVCMGVGDFKL